MMGHVSLPLREDLKTESQRQRWDAEVERTGKTPTHMKRVLLHNDAAYDALFTWYPLYADLEKRIGKRQITVLSYAISTEDECLLCTTWFRRAFKDQGFAIDGGELSPDEQDLADFGRAVVRDRRAPENLVEKLKERLGEDGLVSLTGYTLLMIATNLVNTVLDVQLDDPLHQLLVEEGLPTSEAETFGLKAK